MTEEWEMLVEKAPRRIYLIQRIGVPMELLHEFSRFWRKNTLPFWERNGARLIVAATNLAGGPSNEITRIFEFESIQYWGKTQEATWDWWEEEEGAGRAIPPSGYVKYLSSHVQTLLRAVYEETRGEAIPSTCEAPSEDGEGPKNVYVVHRITVPYEDVDKFNLSWKSNTLPLWQKLGAKLIVAGVNIVGGPANEITHVFEVDNVQRWERIQEATPILPGGDLRYSATVEQRLLRALY